MIAIFFIVELNGPEWMGMLCMNQRKIQTIFFRAKYACVCEEPYHKWAKWVFTLNIYVDLSVVKSGWFCWWGYRAVRDGQLSEACLTNPCGRLTYRGGTVQLADGPWSPAQQVQGGARTTTLSQRLNGNPRSQRLNGNSIPEVKWEKMATRAASLLGFLLFFVMCHAICIFFKF